MTASPDDLSQLMERVVDGDEGAFAALYDATSPRAYSVALRVLRDRAAAEDVTEEAYVDLWRHSAAFDPEQSSAMVWVVTGVYERAARRRPGQGLLRAVRPPGAASRPDDGGAGSPPGR